MTASDTIGPHEDEFSIIANSAPVPMWVSRLDRTRVFVNQAYVDFVGLDYDRALALDWRGILHPDDAERIVAESIAGEASGATFSLEARYRRGDGVWRWLHSVSRPRLDAKGAHIGFIGVAYDVTEAKLAEQELRQREEQLSAFVNQTTAGFAQVDASGRFTIVNDRFCDIVQRPREELYRMTMQDITHPDDLPRNLVLFNRTLADGTSYSHEKRYVRPDGSIVWVNNSVAMIRNRDGNVDGILAVTLDVTARREAEAALRRSEESVRLAIESAGMATWELDLATMDGRWSDNRFELLGYPRAESGRGRFDQWVERIHPEDREWAEGAARRCFETGESFRIDYRILRADTGAVRWLQSHGSRIDFDDGRPSRFVGVSFDITDRKRSEEELRITERRLRFLDALNRATAAATDADTVLAVTTRMLGEHLDLSDCAYADMEPDEDMFNIRGDWHAAHAQSIVGTYSLATFGSLAVANLHAGKPLIVNDNIAELGEDGAQAFLDIGIRATICMPLVKGGRLTALMAIHDSKPRRWTEEELALLTEVTERSWAHIERTRAEASLRESEARLRLAVDSARIGTWDWDLETSTGSWSPRTAAIMGIASGTPITPELRWSLVHPDDRDTVQRQMAALWNDDAEFATEYRVRRHDGTVRWVASHGMAVRDDEGKPVRLTGTIRDVTERRQAQEALEQLNRTLEQQVTERTAERDRMWRLSQDLLLIVGPRWTIRAVNPALAALGYTADDVLGRRFDRFLHRDDLKAMRDAIRQVAKAPVGNFSARLRARDGSWRRFSWSAAPGEGEAYVIGHDITAETERRDQLEQAQDALRQAQKVESLGQLTGGVAHDFNNLLTPIIGSLDLLRRRVALDDRDARLVNGALESAEKARMLVQRLLAFARRQPLQPGPVDLGELVRGMAALIETTVGPQVLLDVAIPPELPLAIGDANQLEMAILNLGVNARDAMPNGGTLRIAAEPVAIDDNHASGLSGGDYVRLSVTDTGQGMDEATRSRAIEPFFSTKGVGKGTGLGLSMVHGLASQLGGALLLDSAPGKGTCVALLLPVTEPAADPAPQPATPGAVAGHGTVLLVDDETHVRRTTAAMLADLGFVVEQCGSAEAALERLKSFRPDYLVTDHLMPGMTGSELVEHARAAHPGLPTLIISGYAHLDAVPRSFTRLAKPFRVEELAATLATLNR